MRATLRGRPGLSEAQRTVLREAVKYLSTDLDSISIAIINATLEIPNWRGIREQLDNLAGKAKR